MRISEAPAAANAPATARPRLPAAPVIRQVLPWKSTVRAGSKLCGRAGLGLHPVLGRSLGVGELARVLETRRHRGGSPGEHLVVVDVEQPEPALLPQGQPDHAAELDQLRLAEVLVHALPESVTGRGVPSDRLRVCERGLLALVVTRRFLEIEQVSDLVLDHCAARCRLDRTLVAAVLAFDRARYVQAAQLLDGVIEHPVLEYVAPRIREEPEAGRNVGADRRALGARRALALAALHLLAHLGVHLFDRNVADSLLWHDTSCRLASGRCDARLLRLEAGRLEDAGVVADLLADELGEFRRIHDHGFLADLGQAIDHVRAAEGTVDVLVDFLDEIPRNARRRP